MMKRLLRREQIQISAVSIGCHSGGRKVRRKCLTAYDKKGTCCQVCENQLDKKIRQSEKRPLKEGSSVRLMSIE
jgi:hypothetical protein